MALKSKSNTSTPAENHEIVNATSGSHGAIHENNTNVNQKHPGKRNKIIMGILASLCVALPAATYFTMKSDMPTAADPEAVKAAVEKFGTVQEQERIGNITANVVKTENGEAVIYSTADGNNLIMGDIYDLDGKPVFEALLQKMYDRTDVAAPQAGNTAEGTIGQVLGEFTGTLPESFNYLESLGGYKEDPSKSPADTVYVVYDPRCPYCHEFFKKSRQIDLAAKGVTIKWLPTTALGSEEPGSDAEKLAVKAMYIKSPEEFAATFGKNPTIPDIEVTDQDRQKLQENLQMLIGSVQELHGPNAPVAVPTAFYMDKKANQPRLVQAPNDDDVFKMIFGE